MPTLLTMDTFRPDGDMLVEADDGLVIRLVCSTDTEGESEYPGSTLHPLEELCPGLIDGFDEEFWDLPQRSRIVQSRHKTHHMPTENYIVRHLLSRKVRTYAPMRVVAGWATEWADRNCPAEYYSQIFINGFLRVCVSIERDGEPIVARTIGGVPCQFANTEYLRDMVQDTLHEAREMLEGGGWLT